MNGDDDTHGFEGIAPAVADRWRQLFEASRSGAAPQDVPPGWITITELAALLGISERYTWQRLRKDPLKSSVERRSFWVRNDQGKVVRRAYVRLLDGAQ